MQEEQVFWDGNKKDAPLEPETDRISGLQTISDYFVNNIKLHYITIMVLLQEKAEQEGIDQQEVDATFEDIMQKQFPAMMKLSEEIAVNTLESLVKLGGISVGTYALTRVDSAEEAQECVYSFPAMYKIQLEKAHLL